MNVIIFGATGMIGQGVLRECLLDPGVLRVVTINRRPGGQAHPKLREIVHPDLSTLAPFEPELRGLDACFFCLGVSSVGKGEEAYSRITYELTLSIANTLARLNPGMTFIYVSGAGTDSSERGRIMWARVKGRTENALLKLSFRAVYMFRPGAIVPLHGIRSSTRLYNVIYLMLRPFLPLIKRLSPDSLTTTEQVARAMIAVARDGYKDRILEMRDIRKF